MNGDFPSWVYDAAAFRDRLNGEFNGSVARLAEATGMSERTAYRYIRRHKQITKPGRLKTALAVGCMHAPYQDKKLEPQVLNLARALQPDRLINNGDWWDCYAISFFDKNPARMDKYNHKRERIAGRDALERLIDACGNPEERDFNEGNHEHRYTRLLYSGAPHLADDERYQLQSHFEIDKLGFNYHGKNGFLLTPKYRVKHGTKTSMHAAKAEYTQARISGCSHHIHKFQTYNESAEGIGNHQWDSSGHLADIKYKDYIDTEYPNWQQGLLVLSYCEVTGMVLTERAVVHDGVLYFRGESYAPKSASL